MIVDIIGKGQSITGADTFKGGDVRPACLPLYNVRIEQISAIVVEARDQIELLSDIGGPSMVRRVMLDEFSCMVGDHFPVMGGLVRFRDVIAVFFALSMIAGRETFAR